MTHASLRSSLRVLVRCRPVLPEERDHTCSQVELDVAGRKVLVKGRKVDEVRCFAFDRIFPPSSQQEDIMEEVTPLINHVLNGVHATIFAYGQTGSGKTFTVDGINYSRKDNNTVEFGAATDPKQHGIIPRVIQQVFDFAREKKLEDKRIRFQFKCSFYQIYKERVSDLLNLSSTDTLGFGLKVGWRQGDVFSVENLFLCECNHPEEMRRVFLNGSRRKVMGTHALNQQSSRSHCVFTIYVTRYVTDSPEDFVKSEFSVVDLAGSEKLALLARDPSALLVRESIDINVSLLALGKVITALAEAKEAKRGTRNSSLSALSHIPYRDSKLTKLLKHSLGGNSFTVMLACISPLDCYVDETLSTLLYACKARSITNVPRVNEDQRSSLIRQLRADVASMKRELVYYREIADGKLIRTELSSPSKAGVQCGSSDVAQVEELAENLIQACEALKKIISVNSQLREAFDVVKTAQADLERREVELNAENLSLRERIEMLEAIVLKSDFEECPSSPLSPRQASQTTLKTKQRQREEWDVDPSLGTKRRASRHPPALKNRPVTAQGPMDSELSRRQGRHCSPQYLRRNSHRMTMNSERHCMRAASCCVDSRLSSQIPPMSGCDVDDVRDLSSSLTLQTQGGETTRQRGSKLIKGLVEYKKIYCRPHHFVNYAEYYGKARQQIPVNRSAADAVKDMEKTLKHVPRCITEAIPCSLKFTSLFGTLSFGGVNEDVKEMKQRRQQREERRNALIAEQRALRQNVTRALVNMGERLESAQYSPPSAHTVISYANASEATSEMATTRVVMTNPARKLKGDQKHTSAVARLRAYLDRDKMPISSADAFSGGVNTSNVCIN